MILSIIVAIIFIFIAYISVNIFDGINEILALSVLFLAYVIFTIYLYQRIVFVSRRKINNREIRNIVDEVNKNSMPKKKVIRKGNKRKRRSKR